MTTNKKRGRGRPPLSQEEKKQRAELREQGILPTVNPNDLTDPGDNTKFLAHALAIRNLPAIDTSDPIQVQNRIDEYFTLCVTNDIKPTVKGFLNSLRVAKSTLWEWKTGGYRAGTHQAIICEAYDVLEALWEDYMMNGKINPVSGIFLGKNNFGYVDKQEHILTPNQQQLTGEDLKIIESKYEELPDE